MNTDPAVTYFEHYARVYDLSESGRRFKEHYYRKLFLPVLPVDRSARILDFGCGAGQLLDWLKAEGCTAAEGVDLDSGQIKFAQGLGVKATLAPDPIAWLRAAGSFDVIFLLDVLEHIPAGQDLPLLCDLYAALNPGGTLVAKVPNANGSFAARNRYCDATHQRAYTELSLHQDLERCRFEQIQFSSDELWIARHPTEAAATIIRFMFRCVRRLEAMAEYGMLARHMVLSQNLMAVCRKGKVATGSA